VFRRRNVIDSDLLGTDDQEGGAKAERGIARCISSSAASRSKEEQFHARSSRRDVKQTLSRRTVKKS
jgi:hypothetical protein